MFEEELELIEWEREQERWPNYDDVYERYAGERYTCPVCGASAYGDSPCSPEDHDLAPQETDDPGESFGEWLLPNSDIPF